MSGCFSRLLNGLVSGRNARTGPDPAAGLARAPWHSYSGLPHSLRAVAAED